MSYKSLVFSDMYRPLINPVWSLWMVFGKPLLFCLQCSQMLFYMTHLIAWLVSVFVCLLLFLFFNCCSLSPFGSNVISPSFCGEDRLSFLKLSFIACTSRVPISFLKLKKFNRKPVPGTSLFHIKEQSESEYLLSQYKFTRKFVLRCTVGERINNRLIF